MMHEFLAANSVELIDRCRLKVAQRRAPKASREELEHGIPLFLEQLIETLKMDEAALPQRSLEVSGPSGGEEPGLSEIGVAATRHGRELSQRGLTIDQVVHDYGDLCQAVTDLAFELDAPIEVCEFRTLNRCLDNAIASAVTEFSNQHRPASRAHEGSQSLNERLGEFAHELRNLINNATQALSLIKSGNLGLGGATGGVLERSLIGLSNLVGRTLAEVRMAAHLPPSRHLFSLANFIAEVKLSFSLEAQVRQCELTVDEVDPLLAIHGDRNLLCGALGNLLQNGFKFTRDHSEVTLRAYAEGERILIDVEDKCGGLPPGAAEKIFQPFAQSGTDKTGLGLGLSICRRSIEADQGALRLRDKPGSGCVFTIDLPRHSLPH